MNSNALTLALALAASLSIEAATFRADDGTVLHYQVAGKGSPVVFLSGGPGFSADYMKPLAETLAATHACVLFHQRGTGLSAMAEVTVGTLALQTLVSDLEALRRELKVEKLTIVAHSWGGILTMLYIADHPERIEKLVLLDSGGPTWQSVPKFAANLEARFSPEERAAIKVWSNPAKVKENRKRAVYELTKAKTPAYFADRARAKAFLDDFREDSFNDAVFWSIAMQLSPALDLRPGLAKMTAPVLVIHGKQDPLESAQEVHQSIPGSRLELIDHAGHFPWLEQPDVVYPMLMEFLAPGAAAKLKIEN